jgi:hypothetical protein
MRRRQPIKMKSGRRSPEELAARFQRLIEHVFFVELEGELVPLTEHEQSRPLAQSAISTQLAQSPQSIPLQSTFEHADAQPLDSVGAGGSWGCGCG